MKLQGIYLQGFRDTIAFRHSDVIVDFLRFVLTQKVYIQLMDLGLDVEVTLRKDCTAASFSGIRT